MFHDDDDDENFQISLSQIRPNSSLLTQRPLKIPKLLVPPTAGIDNTPSFHSGCGEIEASGTFVDCSLDAIPSSFDCASARVSIGNAVDFGSKVCHSSAVERNELLDKNWGYSRNSIESRLLKSRGDRSFGAGNGGLSSDEDDESELDELLKLCSAMEDGEGLNERETRRLSEGDGVVEDDNESSVECPLCGIDISDLSEEQRNRHTNDCLDKEDSRAHEEVVVPDKDIGEPRGFKESDLRSVVEWLHGLGLAKYEDVFVREEIVWDTLQWLTEEDLLKIGITALGPRKKIVNAISQLRQGSEREIEEHTTSHASVEQGRITSGVARQRDGAEKMIDDTPSKTASNKRITDYFPGFSSVRKKVFDVPTEVKTVVKKSSGLGRKDPKGKKVVTRGKLRDPPLWCCIPGTPFRVDAFRYLRGDCSHWFLTHFHMDHYQGLTKSFCRGKIYCSAITAKLVNMKIGITWERLHVLPLNQKMNIDGVDVTCFDANHCPGAIIVLFEPPNGKAVLHTGDFRFCEDKDMMPILQARTIHTLILDTTYCNPQYDFPKQETVIQFVIDAIQAETFNPKTLFLIGSYTIGKERLFLEVARVLRKKIYVNAAKLRILNCLGLPQEDLQWFTLNEKESQVHVVPMWMLGSFKRLKHVANHYQGRYSIIVAFTPTGWTFDKAKKKSPGRKWRQGAIIRYEVPYSEHSSFSELKEFVNIVSPVNIIPSANNDSPESASSMISLLVS